MNSPRKILLIDKAQDRKERINALKNRSYAVFPALRMEEARSRYREEGHAEGDFSTLLQEGNLACEHREMEAAEAAYGTRGLTKLAKGAGISKQLLSFIVAGDREVTDDVYRKVAEAIDKEAERIDGGLTSMPMVGRNSK